MKYILIILLFLSCQKTVTPKPEDFGGCAGAGVIYVPDLWGGLVDDDGSIYSFTWLKTDSGYTIIDSLTIK